MKVQERLKHISVGFGDLIAKCLVHDELLEQKYDLMLKTKNTGIKYELQLIIIYQYWFINCDKRTA